MYSRRPFTRLALSPLALPFPRLAAPLSAAEAATVRGVKIGAIIAMDDAAFESWLESWLLSHGQPGGRYTRPLFSDNSAFNAPLQPVVGVSWHEARAYGAWLSAQVGRTYRHRARVGGGGAWSGSPRICVRRPVRCCEVQYGRGAAQANDARRRLPGG